MTIPRTKSDERWSGVEIVRWIRRVDSFADYALDLVESSGSDAHVVGGAVRDFFFDVPPRDLDIIVPNDDDRLFRLLAARAHPFRVNRHGNRRYFIDERTLDVIRPGCFYQPFVNAEETISYFDISVNALGVHLDDGRFLDPWGGADDILNLRVRTTTRRWAEASDFECVHLMLRLLRYATRYNLFLIDPETVRAHMHKLDRVEWNDVLKYHALSRAAAWRDLSRLVSRPPAVPRTTSCSVSGAAVRL